MCSDRVPHQEPTPLTFAPLTIEGPKNHQISCIGHGPLVQIIFLNFQPVPLPRLICTLRGHTHTQKKITGNGNYTEVESIFSPLWADLSVKALQDIQNHFQIQDQPAPVEWERFPHSSPSLPPPTPLSLPAGKDRCCSYLTFTSFSTNPSKPSRITRFIMSARSEAF